MFRSIALPLVAAIGLIGATHSAVAASHADHVTVRRIAVRYGDLDLGTHADARTTLARLERAAKRACGGDARLNPDYNFTFRELERMYKECRMDAVSRAVAEVDAALLTNLHQAQGGQRLVRASAN